MRNTFFRIALNQAARAVGKPGRLLKLVTQLTVKLHRTNWAAVQLSSIREQAAVLGRMIGAYARGRYRAIPLQVLIAIAGAAIYFINPFDLVPDALVGIGLTDDLAVLTWVYRSATEEIGKFLAWESSLPLKV